MKRKLIYFQLWSSLPSSFPFFSSPSPSNSFTDPSTPIPSVRFSSNSIWPFSISNTGDPCGRDDQVKSGGTTVLCYKIESRNRKYCGDCTQLLQQSKDEATHHRGALKRTNTSTVEAKAIQQLVAVWDKQWTNSCTAPAMCQRTRRPRKDAPVLRVISPGFRVKQCCWWGQ